VPAVPSVRRPAKPEASATKGKTMNLAVQVSLRQASEALANGRIAEACALGEKVSKSHGVSPVAFKFLGQCFMRMGDRERGIVAYQRYLALAPASPDAVFVREMIR
jgi:two-component SAPR family response regulator